MSTWDIEIFGREANTDFLDELASLDDPQDNIESVQDACTLVANSDKATEEERENALCAATIAAIWAGAPFSAGDVADEYPFLRSLVGHVDEELSEAAATILESAKEDTDLDDETDLDIDVFLEALE